MVLAAEEKLQWGCIMVKFTNDKVYQNGCLLYRSNRKYVCPSCSKNFGDAKSMLDHRWAHAY